MDNRKFKLKNIIAILLMVLIVCYSAVNLIMNWSYFEYAIDSGWDFESRTKQLDTVANGQGVGHDWVMDQYSEVQNLLEKKVSNGFQVLRDSDGELNYINFFPYETYDFQHYGERLHEVAEVTEENGGKFLFISAANLSQGMLDSQSEFPVADFKARTDALFYYLQGYGVSYLDSRLVLKKSGIDESLLRYKTDSRWTVEASFEVLKGTLQKIREAFDLELDPQGTYLEDESFERTVYSNSFSGEFARLAGIPFAGKEDFTLYTPTFQTDFTVTTSHFNQEVTAHGSFEEVLVANEILTEENPYYRNMFYAYLGGQAPRRVITNNINPESPKILLIGDEYAAPYAALMAPLAGELHYIWPYDNPSVDDLEAYIEENDFDYVFMVLAPTSMTPTGFHILDD